MTDVLGFGPEKLRQGNLDILAGKVTFRCVPSQPSTPPTRMFIARLQGCVPGDARERVRERTLVRVVQGGAQEE